MAVLRTYSGSQRVLSAFNVYTYSVGVCGTVMSMSVCLSVCLSARMSGKQQTTRPTFVEFSVHVPMAVTQSSSGGYLHLYRRDTFLKHMLSSEYRSKISCT